MRNRAKCKKCECIIESTTRKDEMHCKCGSISVSGGDLMGCAAIDWNVFLRVDDEGNTIVPTIKEAPKPTRQDFLNALDEMIKRIEEMPKQAMVVAINHYDFVSLLILLSSIFGAESSDIGAESSDNS
jgi:predicted  nucleic acid-binding Zn-ribbon protein